MTARAEARLAVAITRGLLLDLLATGDRDAVDEAFECYLQHAGHYARTAGQSGHDRPDPALDGRGPEA